MPRGGARPGAGRKSKGNHLNPTAIKEIRAKIKSHHIIKRLNLYIDGEIELPGPAVTAALGLLRKVIPDLSAVQHSGDDENPLEVIHRIERVIVHPQDTDSESL